MGEVICNILHLFLETVLETGLLQWHFQTSSSSFVTSISQSRPAGKWRKLKWTPQCWLSSWCSECCKHMEIVSIPKPFMKTALSFIFLSESAIVRDKSHLVNLSFNCDNSLQQIASILFFRLCWMFERSTDDVLELDTRRCCYVFKVRMTITKFIITILKNRTTVDF